MFEGYTFPYYSPCKHFLNFRTTPTKYTQYVNTGWKDSRNHQRRCRHRTRSSKALHREGCIRLHLQPPTRISRLSSSRPRTQRLRCTGLSLQSRRPGPTRLYEAVKAERGTLDIIFANSGTGSQLRVGEVAVEQCDEILNTNVKGPVFTVQKALPLIGKGGLIILTGSSAGTTGAPAFGLYSASKAAVRSLALI